MFHTYRSLFTTHIGYLVPRSQSPDAGSHISDAVAFVDVLSESETYIPAQGDLVAIPPRTAIAALVALEVEAHQRKSRHCSEGDCTYSCRVAENLRKRADMQTVNWIHTRVAARHYLYETDQGHAFIALEHDTDGVVARFLEATAIRQPALNGRR